MILIGLDPGTHTGVAVWDCEQFRFLALGSMRIHIAMDEVMQQARHLASRPILVVWEDARLRKVFTKMDEKISRYGMAVREGAGAAKRDAQIWHDFLEDHKIPNLPKKPNNTKRSHVQFMQISGRPGRTNEHARDAGMLVVQINEPTAQGMLRTACDKRLVAKPARRA